MSYNAYQPPAQDDNVDSCCNYSCRNYSWECVALTFLAVLLLDVVHFQGSGFVAEVSYEDSTWFDFLVVLINWSGFLTFGLFGDVLGDGTNRLAFRVSDLGNYFLFYAGGILPWLFMAWVAGRFINGRCRSF